MESSTFNYRRRFNQAAMDALVEDIKRQGILQSILVRSSDAAQASDAVQMIKLSDIKVGKYQVIAGNRRVRAAEIALGDDAPVPALVRIMTDAQAMAAMVSENKVREDTTAIEDGEAAMRMLGLLNGDRDETAKRLGWSLATLKSRLGIMNATQAVRDAYIDEKILLGHVEILAALVTTVQDSVLKKMLDYPRTITVVELKAMAEQQLLNLDAAIFNKDECTTCRYNTGEQRALFETAFEGARCTNRECYETKTEGELQLRSEALKVDYQVVRIVRAGDNMTVVPLRADGAKGVGEAQALACRTCGEFGACVSAAPDKLGASFKNVCFNPTCNAEKVAVHKQSQQLAQAPVAPATQASTGQQAALSQTPGQTTPQAATAAATKAAKDAVKAPVASSEPRNGVKEHREVVWRGVFQRGALRLPMLQSRALLVTLCLSRPGNLDSHMATDAVDKLLGTGSLDKTSPDLLLSSVLCLAQEDLGKAMQHIASFVGKDLSIRDITAFMSKLDIKIEDYWRVNAEFFDMLTKVEIDAVCVELGLNKAMGDTYSKFKAGSKADYIKAILGVAGYDYAGKIPAFMRW